MNPTKQILNAAAFIGCAGLCVATQAADSAPMNGMNGTNSASGPGGRPPVIEAIVDSSYSGAGDSHFAGAKRQSSDAWQLNLGVKGIETIDDQWSAPFELSSRNMFLQNVSGAPVPDKINTLSLRAGAAYKLNDEWMLSATAGPQFYKFDDVGANDIGFSALFSAIWRVNTNVTAFMGFAVAPDGEIPVIPLAGVDWRITSEWELSVFFPRPRVIYHLNDELSFHLGLTAEGDIFRTSNNTGNKLGLPQYNDALGYYQDIRVGVGAEWKLSGHLSLEAETGYSVDRQIDYHRIHEHVRFDDAPFVQLGLKTRF